MSARRPAAKGKERGVLIVALMAGIAIMMILSTVAVQSWADILKRDNEAEMMFRAQDIARALVRYQKDHGQYPTELKQLLEVGNPTPRYYIRQLWKDPLVKGGKWQLLYANPAGGFIDPSAPPVEGGTGLPGQSGPSGLSSLFGQSGQPGTSGSTGLPTSGIGQQNSGGFPPIGQGAGDPGELTGMPIVGVKTRCKDHPFRRYRDKTEYTEWVFTVFDLQGAQAAVAKPAQGMQPNPGQQGGGFPPVGGGK